MVRHAGAQTRFQRCSQENATRSTWRRDPASHGCRHAACGRSRVRWGTHRARTRAATVRRLQACAGRRGIAVRSGEPGRSHPGNGAGGRTAPGTGDGSTGSGARGCSAGQACIAWRVGQRASRQPAPVVPRAVQDRRSLPCAIRPGEPRPLCGGSRSAKRTTRLEARCPSASTSTTAAADGRQERARRLDDDAGQHHP